MAPSSSGFDARALLISLDRSSGAPTDPRVRVASGRLDAAVAALRIGFDADVALFWHLDLVKLAPLLRLSRTCRTIVFLHGIESWRRQSALVRRALSRVDVVFTNTSFTHKRALTHIPELAGKPAHLVHLGLGEPLRGQTLSPDDIPAAIMISRL